MDLREIFSEPQASILYVGASVTVQKEGYRPALHALLEREVGRTIKMHINALGGVGSLFGLANTIRYQELYTDVRLVVFEYSTGDLNMWITPRNLLEEVITSFLELLRTISNNVVVVHNYRSDFAGDKGDIIRGVYNRAAEANGIPVAAVHRNVEEHLTQHPQEYADLFRDHVHSTARGSEYVAGKLLEQLSAVSWPGGQREPMDVSQLPQYVTLDMVTNVAKDSIASFVYQATGQEFQYLELMRNERLVIDVEGELLAIVVLLGPRTGNIQVTVGSDVRTIPAFDRNCHYNRPHCLPLQMPLPTGTRLTIEVAPGEVDTSILKLPHRESSLPRTLRFNGLIGRRLKLDRVVMDKQLDQATEDFAAEMARGVVEDTPPRSTRGNQ